MPLFIALGKFTDQGRKTIKDSPRRYREAMSMADKLGVRIHQALFTTGRYDLVTVIEAPNVEAALAVGLGSAATGNIHWETLDAFPVEQIEKVISRLP